MPKFSPGDLVWARPPNMGSLQFNFLHRETPAVVTHIIVLPARCCIACRGNTCYVLDICPQNVCVCGCILRPRRDDYQQHEGLGTRDQLDKPIRELTDAELARKINEIAHATQT